MTEIDNIIAKSMYPKGKVKRVRTSGNKAKRVLTPKEHAQRVAAAKRRKGKGKGKGPYAGDNPAKWSDSDLKAELQLIRDIHATGNPSEQRDAKRRMDVIWPEVQRRKSK